MIRRTMCFVLASVVSVAASIGAAPAVHAQCDTCATPTVAYYQPTVAYQPVATQQVRTGWYPGRWFDRRRMRRWGVSTAAAPAPTYTVGYAPTAAAYTPYTAAYAYTPTSYTAAYRPYVTAYAPLARPASYTVARPVVMSPVVSTCGTCGCNPCSCNPCGCAQPACGGCGTCSSCSSCSSGVSQAVYGAPSTGCSSCAAGSGVPIYSGASTGSSQIPQPQLAPNETIPDSSRYESQRQESIDTTTDPEPVTDSSTYFEAPKLFNPRDRSASRPTVDVHNAVYRQPVTNHAASHVPAKEVDEHGWSAVSVER